MFCEYKTPSRPLTSFFQIRTHHLPYTIPPTYTTHPSKIATHLAASAPAQKRILIDTFAGAGGNTIAFARSGRWDQIFAIEKDRAVLECARHNADIYGVRNKIVWIEGDCFEILKRRLKSLVARAVVFGSPPWGGGSFILTFLSIQSMLDVKLCGLL